MNNSLDNYYYNFFVDLYYNLFYCHDWDYKESKLALVILYFQAERDLGYYETEAIAYDAKMLRCTFQICVIGITKFL